MGNNILFGKTILVVEDDLSSRLYINKILEKAGATILNCDNGQSAIDTAINTPDLDFILMDIQLPVIDGYESVRRIKDVRKDIIVIAQTAYGLTSDREKINAAGFDDCIIKPIFASHLIEKLSAWIKK